MQMLQQIVWNEGQGNIGQKPSKGTNIKEQYHEIKNENKSKKNIHMRI